MNNLRARVEDVLNGSSDKKILPHLLDGKPFVEINEDDTYRIQVKNHKEFNSLMQVFELNDFRWDDFSSPTSRLFNPIIYEQNCIYNYQIPDKTIGIDEFSYWALHNTVISTDDFFASQNISPNLVKEVNNWFDTHKSLSNS